MSKININYQGDGTPNISLGEENETYLNTNTNELFVKNNNYWKSLGKRRGRKPGSKSPKNIYFVCVGYSFVEEISLKEEEENSNNDLKSCAIKQFVDKHKEEPSFVFGPFYKRKSLTIDEQKNSNNIDLNSISFKEDRISAIFEDWMVSVKLIEEHDDTAFVIFKSNINENSKKTKPFPKIVKLNNLKDITKLN